MNEALRPSRPCLHMRRADPADIPAMSSIRLGVSENVLSNPAKVTLAMYRDYMDTLGRAWVCEADGRVAGFCYALRADGAIWALFVDPHYEGLGIGRGLLDLACAWLRAIGQPRAILSTGAGTRAERFYLAQGWRVGAGKANEVLFERDL